jgi:hypothetical protein
LSLKVDVRFKNGRDVTVTVIAKRVDTKSSIVLWKGGGTAQSHANSSGDILANIIAAAITVFALPDR